MPKGKISKRTVDAMKPAASPVVLWDSELVGFGLKVTPAGRKTYIFKYRVGGGRSGRGREPVIGVHGPMTPDRAREIALRWAALVAEGGDPASDREAVRKAPTVSEVLDRYLAEHVARKNKASTERNARQIIDKIVKPELGRLKIADVTRADVERLHAKLSGAPYRANRILALLSKVFELAERWGHRPNHSNPARGVDRYPEKARERFLSPGEFGALGEALSKAERGELVIEGEDGKPAQLGANPEAVNAIRLAIFTGARIGEILAARWEWLNVAAARLELPDSKTGSKHVHLSPPALELLARLDRPESGKGFVIRGGRTPDPETPLTNYKDPWRAVRKAAGLDGVRVHDLRHSFASVVLAGGAGLPMIGALLGHRDVKTTARYAHLAEDPKRAAADAAGGRIAAAMAGLEEGAEVIPIRRGG